MVQMFIVLKCFYKANLRPRGQKKHITAFHGRVYFMINRQLVKERIPRRIENKKCFVILSFSHEPTFNFIHPKQMFMGVSSFIKGRKCYAPPKNKTMYSHTFKAYDGDTSKDTCIQRFLYVHM